MRRTIPWAVALLLTACLSTGQAQGVAPAAAARPRPYPVFETPAFARAVAAGTRTRSGRPGQRYWQQWAEYRLQVELDPATSRLTGRGAIRYFNRSPDTLRSVYLHLRQNLFAPNGIRNVAVPITGGIQLGSVAVGGRELARLGPESEEGTSGWEVEATLLHIRLPAALVPGASVDLNLSWSYTVAPDGAPRGGTDGQVWFVSYWYPQLAVYDDVNRWQTDPYMGRSEFYMGYGDYDVAITVPEGWLVAATGALENPAEVLSTATRDRLARARASGEIVHVVADEDRGAGRATARGAGGRLTWHFRATNVRDVSFATSDRYLWDATVALAGDADGDGRPDTVQINTFYRPDRRSWAWDQSARYERHSIAFLSRFLWPYPWLHMDAVDGVVSCAGMEFPMQTCIGGPRDTTRLYSVLVHETAHMWFPMQVGSDEQRYAWQDEGLTRYNQGEAMAVFFPGYDIYQAQGVRSGYLDLAREGGEVELMRRGDLYPLDSPAYSVASYSKMALTLRSLRAILGDSTFLRAYREYGRRWQYRHPTPYDFWNTFSDVSGRNLDWFWRTWFYETWTLDQAIASVMPRGRDLEVVIEDRGLAPMPVRLAITRSGGAVEWMEVPVDVWLAGARRHTVRVPGGREVVRVEIDPDNAFPDADRTNQTWVR